MVVSSPTRITDGNSQFDKALGDQLWPERSLKSSLSTMSGALETVPDLC